MDRRDDHRWTDRLPRRPSIDCSRNPFLTAPPYCCFHVSSIEVKAREGSSTAVRWEIRDWGKENRETGKQEEKQGRCGLSERYRKMTRKKMRKGKGKCNRKTENREVEMRQETERENGKEKEPWAMNKTSIRSREREKEWSHERQARKTQNAGGARRGGTRGRWHASAGVPRAPYGWVAGAGGGSFL